MATVAQRFVSLVEAEKRAGHAEMIELMAQYNPILDDALWLACNQGTKHETLMRVGIPDSTFTKFYQGTQPKRSSTTKVTDATAMIREYIELDKDEVDMFANGDAKMKANLMLQERDGIVEGMNNAMARQFFYGSDASDPSAFLGLTPRFNDPTAMNGKQIINAGGTGADNTSIWFVVWGRNTVHGIYPSGVNAGLKIGDIKEAEAEDDEGKYPVYRQRFTWHCGVAVRDWRYVVRIANVSQAKMNNGSLKLYDFMRKAYYQLHQRRVVGGRAAIYANADVLEYLDALGTNAGANDNFVRLVPRELEGKEVPTYRGIPIRESDSLLNTEEAVTFA